jgi:peptidoglycan/LPS O-acetylase OafA/YrhL
MFVTAALRNLSACSAGLLLYRTLVPVEHPWHFSSLASFFSLSIWKHVAAISYCSYLVHFRLLMEVIYSVPLQLMFGLTIPAVALSATTSAQSIDALVVEWLILMVKVFVIGIGVSFTVAKILHEVVEKPAASIIAKYIFPRKQSPIQGKKLL